MLTQLVTQFELHRLIQFTRARISVRDIPLSELHRIILMASYDILSGPRIGTFVKSKSYIRLDNKC